MDYLLIRSHIKSRLRRRFVVGRALREKKMNLIFRLIAEKKTEKSGRNTHARLGHRYDDIMYSDAADLL